MSLRGLNGPSNSGKRRLKPSCQACFRGVWRSNRTLEGLAHECQLLRRLAAACFGATTADHLARALAAEVDPERLAVVGEAIVRFW